MICNDTPLACWRPGYTECRKLSLQSRCDPAESHILSMPFTPLLGFLTPFSVTQSIKWPERPFYAFFGKFPDEFLRAFRLSLTTFQRTFGDGCYSSSGTS